MSKTDELVKQAKAFDRKYEKYKLAMVYDGKDIAEYDMLSGDRSIDTKSVESWVRGNMVFLVALKGLNSNNVSLRLVV